MLSKHCLQSILLNHLSQDGWDDMSGRLLAHGLTTLRKRTSCERATCEDATHIYGNTLCISLPSCTCIAWPCLSWRNLSTIRRKHGLPIHRERTFWEETVSLPCACISWGNFVCSPFCSTRACSCVEICSFVFPYMRVWVCTCLIRRCLQAPTSPLKFGSSSCTTTRSSMLE